MTQPNHKQLISVSSTQPSRGMSVQIIRLSVPDVMELRSSFTDAAPSVESGFTISQCGEKQYTVKDDELNRAPKWLKALPVNEFGFLTINRGVCATTVLHHFCAILPANVDPATVVDAIKEHALTILRQELAKKQKQLAQAEQFINTPDAH